jgi:deoxyribodipyrimidine photo-lyase
MALDIAAGRVPAIRIRTGNNAPVFPERDYVLYWMTAHRRIGWNFCLQRAVEWCLHLGKPLVVLEALRCDYPWACDRMHRFLLEGMVDNNLALRKRGITYYPYLEATAGAGKGLLSALAQRAGVIIGDDYPAFFYPRMLESASRQMPVRLEFVDSNGILPLNVTDRVFATAFSFRAFLQKNLRAHLYEFPDPNPLTSLPKSAPAKIPASILQRWPPRKSAEAISPIIQRLPIDHSVPSVRMKGGHSAAQRALLDFAKNRLDGYARERNEPEKNAASGLSPYLHFGHLSAHQVFHCVMSHSGWSIESLAATSAGKRSGWWGVSESTEAFLDQLTTWRELGFNMCCHAADYEHYASLPLWARRTLAEHRKDPRHPCYRLEDFECARTHDLLWNAAQGQLLREGRIHNYLRMLWGKKILEWSADPQEALRIMIELNNKYALDGRDPNSYSGIFWILGRYDRPWGPERPIFGKVRYMSSENTARKFRVSGYVARYSKGI